MVSCPSTGYLPLRNVHWYKRLHAALLAQGNARYAKAVDGYKRALFGELEGAVLEIGPGAGVNLPYYRPDVHWTGVEPNPYAHDYLRREAERLNLAVDIRPGAAEQLPARDESIDAVVSSLVLCTVHDVPGALREALRVLKPGGRFVFIEHVAAPAGTWLRSTQRAIRPLWQVLGDGCQPDRETWRAIEDAGFARVEMTQFRAPVPIAGPHIAGFAVK